MRFPRFALIWARHTTAVLCTTLVLLTTLSAQKRAAVNNWTTSIPISDCTTISNPGSYVLTNDLTCPNLGNSQDTGITITASNVTLHLSGHAISAAGDAVNASSVADVDIIGPGTVGSLATGVRFTNVNNSRIVGVTCSDAITCIISSGTANRIMANEFSEYELGMDGEGQGNFYIGNQCSGGYVGIEIQGQHDLIEGNRCGGTAFWAFYIQGTSETVMGNQADDNGNYGIYVAGTGNHIKDNEASNNSEFDLEDYDGTCGQNSWKSNAFTTANIACIH